MPKKGPLGTAQPGAWAMKGTRGLPHSGPFLAHTSVQRTHHPTLWPLTARTRPGCRMRAPGSCTPRHRRSRSGVGGRSSKTRHADVPNSLLRVDLPAWRGQQGSGGKKEATAASSPQAALTHERRRGCSPRPTPRAASCVPLAWVCTSCSLGGPCAAPHGGTYRTQSRGAGQRHPALRFGVAPPPLPSSYTGVCLPWVALGGTAEGRFRGQKCMHRAFQGAILR